MPTSRAIGEPQTRMYSTPGEQLPIVTPGSPTRHPRPALRPTSYADSHLFGQLRDRSRRRAAGTPEHVGKDLVGEGAAADLGGGEPVALEQHLAGLLHVAD